MSCGPFSRGTGTATGLPLSSLIAWVSMIALSTKALPVSRWQSSQWQQWTNIGFSRGWYGMDPRAQPPVTFFAMVNDPSEANCSLVVLPDVFPHLVMPVGPFVPALRAPVVQMMRNAAIPQNLRHSVGRPAVLPRTTAGHESDVATRVLMEKPGIILVSHIVHRVIEVKVVVVHSVH